MKKTKCKIGSLELRTPIILGSCDLFNNVESIRKNYKDLVGAIVLKTTSREPREGHKKPHMAKFGDNLLVASGNANPGIDAMCKIVRELKDIPLIGCVMEPSLAKEYAEAGAIAVELNLSCPNLEEDIPAQHPEEVFEAVKKAKSLCDVPIIAKLTGWNCNLRQTAKAAEEAGAEAIVVSNLFPGMGFYTGLVEQEGAYKIGEPLLGRGYGAYTGKAFLSGVLLMIQRLRKEIKIPIIATGGCCNDLDSIVQTFMSGAVAIETVTPLYQGKDPSKLYREYLEWREKNDI